MKLKFLKIKFLAVNSTKDIHTTSFKVEQPTSNFNIQSNLNLLQEF